jgi:hypothetical protein
MRLGTQLGTCVSGALGPGGAVHPELTDYRNCANSWSVSDTLYGQHDALCKSGPAEPLSHDAQQPVPLLAKIEVTAGQ